MTSETLYLDVGGKKTQVQKGGAGPPVVYLHSALGETDWLPFHDQLSADYTVFVPAHPGFADSEGLDQISDMEDMSFHYGDLFAELGVDRPALVGMSLGGWIAAEYAVRWPDTVSKLVLIDAAGLRVPEAPVVDMWATRPPQLAELMFADQTHPLAMMMHAFQPEQPPPPEVLVPFYKAQQATARVGWNPYLHNPKLEGRLGRISAPTLVLWGDRDRFIPFAHAERYAKLIAGARLERISEAGHLPVLERPDGVLTSLKPFLADG